MGEGAEPMKVLIAGGGIGGLTLALMLHRRGIDSVVFEQASEIREVGVGINILPHAIKELAALGLLPKLDAAGIRTKELHYVSRLGQKVWSETAWHGRWFRVSAVLDASRPTAESDPRRSDRRTWSGRDTHRPEAAGLSSRTRAASSRISPTPSSELSSETVRGDVLVGADGIHSVARRHFYPEAGSPELARAHALARRCGLAEVPDRALDVYRRRHEREGRALSDRAGLDAGNPPHQLGDRLSHRRRRDHACRRSIPGRGSGAWTK